MPEYKTEGVCATRINFDVDEQGVVGEVGFVGGCPGNAVGVSLLSKGRKASELIELFDGLPCGKKSTSCPDQLARALREHLDTNTGVK